MSLLLVTSCKTKTDQPMTMMWKMSANGSTIYMLGSIHAAEKALYPMDPAIEEAFNDSEKVIFESNPDMSQADQYYAAKQSMFLLGGSLKETVDAETYTMAATQAKELNISEEQLNKCKPWMAAFQLTYAQLAKAGYSQANGVESYFQKRAKESDKETGGMATPKQHIDYLANLPVEIQSKFLKYSLQEAGEMIPEFKKILQAWKESDLEAIEESIIAGQEKHPDMKPMNDVLVDQRNNEMTEKIISYTKEGKTYFVVAGSAHFVGETGIIGQLKAKGFKVEQVPCEAPLKKETIKEEKDAA